MKIFKPYKIFFLLVTVLSIISCTNNDDDQLTIQPHDSNKMMQIVHTMTTAMDKMALTGDPDEDFAMMMIMHHQGAIDMANEQLKSGDDATIKTIAQNVINAQTAEKVVLTEFMNAHAVEGPSNEEFKMEIMSSMEKMNQAKDLRVITGDTDNDFAQLLITHHQSALEMADAELHHGKHPELVAMAQKMIEDQQMEIKELQEWLLKNKPY